jgi:hypothetical protein
MKAIPCPIDPERLQALYHEEKFTDDQIVDLLNSEGHEVEATVKRVRSWRQKFGIRTLKKWERHEVPPIEGRLRSLLLGSMLGDGGIGAGLPRYIENHCEEQKAYLEWKASIWGEAWVPDGVKPVLWDGKYPGFRFQTVSHPSLYPYRDLFYENREKGWKRPSPEVIDQVDAFALAIWYLDDGSANWWPLITFGADASSRPVAEAIFAKFGLAPRWEQKTLTTGQYHMEREDTAHKFLDIIRPHVPECMSYKLSGFGFQGAHYQVRQKLTEEALRPLAEAGVPIKRIAQELGVAATTVDTYLRKFGIEHPRQKGNPKHREARG